MLPVINHENNYTIGAGRLFFKPLGDSSFHYFGNTSTMTATRATTVVDHYSSDMGAQQKDLSIITRDDMTIAFTCDDLSEANMALWFAKANAKPDIVTSVAGAATTQNAVVSPGKYVLVGSDTVTPYGVLANTVTVTTGAAPGTAVDPSAYMFDSMSNMVYFLTADQIVLAGGDAAKVVAENAAVTVSYTPQAETNSVVTYDGAQINGSINYVADNKIGNNGNMFIPNVQLQATSDLAMKGTDVATMSFTGNVIVPQGYVSRIFRSLRIADPA